MSIEVCVLYGMLCLWWHKQYTLINIYYINHKLQWQSGLTANVKLHFFIFYLGVKVKGHTGEGQRSHCPGSNKGPKERQVGSHQRQVASLLFFSLCYRYSLDEFGTARRTAIVRGFIDALTRGGKIALTDIRKSRSILPFGHSTPGWPIEKSLRRSMMHYSGTKGAREKCDRSVWRLHWSSWLYQLSRSARGHDLNFGFNRYNLGTNQCAIHYF